MYEVYINLFILDWIANDKECISKLRVDIGKKKSGLERSNGVETENGI